MSLHRSGLPPLSQPLQNHFRAIKKSSATPSNDTECNPFLGAAYSALSSSSSSSSLASSPLISLSSSSSSTTTKTPTLASTASSSTADCIRPSTNHTIKGSRKLPLGDHHATLLSLHSAVEHALVVHLATSGGSAADSSSSATSQIQLPNVITFSTLRPIVERSCGRRLDQAELARLMWLWGSDGGKADDSRAGCNVGIHVSKGRTMDKSGNKSFDYYLSLQVGVALPGEEEEERSDAEVYGAGRGVNGVPSTPPRKKARLLDLPEEPQTPSPSPRSINVFARHPHLSTPPSSPFLGTSSSPQHRSPTKRQRSVSANDGSEVLGSPRRIGSVGGGALQSIGLVASWNSGIESRKREVRRRLVKWTVDCYHTWKEGGRMRDEEVDAAVSRPSTPPPTARRAVEGLGGMLTPSATREGDWIPGQKRIRDFFAVEKGLLDEKEEEEEGKPSAFTVIRDWDPDFPLNRVAFIPEAALPENPAMPISQQRSQISERVRRSAERMNSRAAAATQPPILTATKAATSMTLAERIKAKELLKREQSTLRDGNTPLLRDGGRGGSDVMANLKRRSTLSRLQDVAESLYMLFSSKATEEAGTSDTKRYPHLPINEVAKSICKSSKVAMSEVEARHSFGILRDLAPGFIEINKVGAREWVRMGVVIQGEEVHSKTGGVLGAVRRRIRLEMDKS
ncbi:hypothetical protein CBS101457_000366 [Exobasidium rhododendri]|nr:hypothetical protein CBS101457_000366 [Exobasidium rhododendri]